MRDILLFSITAYCTFGAVRNPAFGMLAYVCFSLLAPHSLVWGAARTFPHVQMIAIGTLLGYALSSGQKKFPRQREVFLLLALWGVFGLSTLFAFHPDEASEFFFSVSKALLMVFLAMALIMDEQQLRLLARVIALSIGFHAFKIGFFVVRTGGQGAVYGPDSSFLEANNSLGMALAMNVPFLFYVAKTETIPWLRYLMRMMLVFSYPATIGTFSRGAWLALATATGLLVLKSRYRLLGILVSGVLVMSSPLWISYIISEKITERFDTLKNYEEDESANSRFWNWEFCTRVGLAKPLTGGGFYLYSQETYAIYFPEFLERYPNKVWSCHSTWLSMLAEHGFPGFFLWIVLLGGTFAASRQLRVQVRHRHGPTWLTDYASMLEVALASYIVSSTFVDVGYFEVYYFSVVMVIIMKEIAQRQKATVPASLETVEVRNPAFGEGIPELRKNSRSM